MDRKTAALELPETNISSSVALFYKAVLEAAKMFIPRARRRDYQPYWTPEFDNFNKALDQAREKMESSPTNANVEAHSKAKAQYTRARTQGTRNSWHDKTASLNMEKDTTGLWNLTRALNNDNPSKSKPAIEANKELIREKRAANVFADLYREQRTTHVVRERIKQVRKETENIILTSHGEERDCSTTDPFSMNKLKDAFKKLKSKKAPGPDGITGEMLKHLEACSRAVLLKIFNHSLMKGVVPAVWKEAIIIPVPEKGKDKKNPRSYRPISLLSCVGKLLERIVNRRLIGHLESNSVLSPTQTGYRKFRSTEDQLAYLAQNIEDAFQEKNVLAVFFDLSNAFDKVWKEGLLVKLLRNGVRCKMYMWIQHFLFARTTRVKLDGILSKKVCLREGVPQGGVLSPTRFLVYINDILTTISKRVSNTLHADDLAVWNASEHTTTATYRIQEAISSINKWTLDWDLEINISKTNSTLFSLSTSEEQIKLRLNDGIVPQTDTTTFLGVKLDTRLTWKPQIEKMERSSLQKLALMRNLTGTTLGADSSILAKVYTATVRPTMEYASTTWGTAAMTNKNRLDKVQNMALRVRLGAMKTTPVHVMEKTANVEPLERRRSLKILIQGEKLRRLPSHPLHTNLAQLTKNRLRRQSLNHQYKELSRTHQDIVAVPTELLTDPAWTPDRDADIQTSLSVPGITSKEQLPGELRNLTLALIADRFPHNVWTRVYTDGSAEEGMKIGGSGVYIKYPDGNTTSLSVPGGLQCSNYRAEILAICTAAEHLLESGKNMGNIAIFTDSLSTLQALNSADPDQKILGLHSSLAKLTAQHSVSLQWVPAHVGLTGNETADRLAKIGSQALQTQNPVTYREAKTFLHSRYTGDWKKENGGYQAHLDPIWRLEQAQQTTIFHLRTGHCGLSAHLKRIGISDTSLCECVQGDQTPDHVLQSCPIYTERRQLT